MQRSSLGAFVALMTLMMPIVWPQEADCEPRPEFRYQSDSEEVILDYSVLLLFDQGQPDFGIKIYGDGRTVASIPEGYSRRRFEKRGLVVSRRGHFETRLTPGEVEEILRAVEPAFTIDVERTRKERNSKKPGVVTDGGLTLLTIRLTDYKPAEGEWMGPIAQEIKWRSLSGDSRLYPGVAGIQRLREATSALSQWIYRIVAEVDAEERGR